MIKFENVQVVGWEPSIRGMRNPKNSWDRSDSYEKDYIDCEEDWELNIADMCGDKCFIVGPNDHNLMMSLAKGGPVHAKYRRMIHVYVDITAPLYWWKEADTYRMGLEKNSCSTMHKIHSKPFEMEDFSNEDYTDKHFFQKIVNQLEKERLNYINSHDKKFWRNMIQLLPSSYNQKRTVDISYETLANIYEYRRNHKLDEWREMCKWIESLPYSEIITKPILEQSKKVNVEEVMKVIEGLKAKNPHDAEQELAYNHALDNLMDYFKER